ncbi:thioester-containing protein 1 allele R1-like [Chironomus tepperi]|uniref:thioester-containing protein 1 allele R1-like n=1 Tax=Chironomus tepperi TaxID=113505 RepID=UPI00391F1F57
MNCKMKFLIFCGLFVLLMPTLAQNSEGTCGRVAIGRGNIIRGNYAKRGLFPWAAVLMNNGEKFCGGTLLTNNLVLTAAHCIHGKEDQYKYTTDNITVVLGAHNFNVDEPGRVYSEISSINVHEDWNVTSESHDADIAMLTLKESVTFSSYIQPICLIPPESNIAEISDGYAVGYGKNQNQNLENVLKYVKMPIELSNEECFYTNPALVSLSSRRTFCAGDRNGSGVCEGDSGNGLFVKYRGVHYLRGIVSASIADPEGCDTYNYAVFTNVIKFHEWITDIINHRFQTQSQVYLIGSRWITAKSGNKIFQTIINIPGNDVTVQFKDQNNNIFNVNNLLTEFKFDVFEVPENATNYNLKMTLKSQNTCKAQSVNILNVESSPIVFVQFNKPIYSSNEAFIFRIFILTRNLLPVADYGPIYMKFRDSDNVEVLRFNSAILTDQFGVYEDKINIWELLNRGAKLGIWTLEVTAADRKVIKTFEVQHLNNETEVFVDGPSIVAFVDRKMYLTIHTKDPYDRTAVIYVAAKFINSNVNEIDKFVKEVPLTGLKTVVPLDFQDDLDIRSPTVDMDLSFTVEITGENPTSVNKNIKMRHIGRNTIQVIKKNYFKPGYKFPIKVRVKDLDGKPDNSLNQLKTTIMYVSGVVNRQTRKRPISDVKEFHTNLMNGEAILQLEPKADTRKIIASFEIADTEHTEEIDRFPGVAEYMQVTMLNKSSTIGSTVQIKVQSSEEMEVLRLLIFGTKGIIHSQQFDDAAGKDLFDFPLVLTDEMRPEARGLVYYARASDGALVYDEFSLSIGFTIENSLEISAPEQAEPQKFVDITVKTEEDSQVFLIVTDVNAALFNHENEITRPAIYNELVYHLNKKFKPTSNYHFEKINVFILDPAKYGYDCNTPKDDDNDNDDLQPRSEIDMTSHKYFPTALSEIIYTASSSNPQTVQMSFPDTTTTWKIYGISVHPEKGFTVAKTQPEIAVKATRKIEELRLEITGPMSIIQDEVRDYYIVATNELKTYRNLRVLVTIENGHFIEEVPIGNCRQHKKSTDLAFQLDFTPEIDVMHAPIQVTSHNAQPIRISAIIKERNAKANAIIEVLKNAKNSVKKTMSNTLVDITGQYPRFEMDLVNSDPSKKVYATIYGNILGPAVDGLEKILSRKMIFDEDKVLKFGTEVVIYKFLKNLGLAASPKARTVFTNVRNYYNESKLILDSLIQSKSINIWLVALIADIMNDASTIIEVNFSLIVDSLAFIIDQLSKNYNKFPYDIDLDNRRDINRGLKSKNPQTKDWIEPTLSKLSAIRGEDHYNAILAYTLASNGLYDRAETFLNNVNPANLKTGYNQRDFSINVETISYLILTKIILNLDPRNQVMTLLEHRSPDGAFYSPYDTYLSLKALSKFSEYRKMTSQRLIFELNQKYDEVYPFESKTINVDEYNQKLAFAHMTLGYVNVFYEGTDEIMPTSTAFTLRRVKVHKILQLLEIILKISYKASQFSNLVVVEVDIPEGYQYFSNYGNIDVLDVVQEDQKVVLYLKKFEYFVEYSLSIRLSEKPNSTKFHKPLWITIYDYYRPNVKDVFQYDLLCV